MINTIVILFLMDFLLTYISLYRTSKLVKDWHKHEMNPIVSFMLGKFGLHKGMLYTFLIFGGIVYALSNFIIQDIEAFLTLKGMYIVIFFLHIIAYFRINSAMKKKQMEDKIIMKQVNLTYKADFAIRNIKSSLAMIIAGMFSILVGVQIFNPTPMEYFLIAFGAIITGNGLAVYSINKTMLNNAIKPRKHRQRN